MLQLVNASSVVCISFFPSHMVDTVLAFHHKSIAGLGSNFSSGTLLVVIMRRSSSASLDSRLLSSVLITPS